MSKRNLSLHIGIAIAGLAVAAAMAQSFNPVGLGAGTLAPPSSGAQSNGPRWVQPSEMTGAAIERAVQTAYRTGARCFIPPGTYLITRTLDFSRLGPIVIEGNAMCMMDQWRSSGGVELKWTGEAGGTMIRLGAFAVQFSNFTLNGNNLAAIGVHNFD